MGQGKIGDMIIAAGVAGKDAELKRVGDSDIPVCEFGISVGKKADGSGNIFANCKAWRSLGEYASHIKKGDSVCVVGRLESREYNGKTYHTLVADWLNIAGERKAVQEIAPNGIPYHPATTFESSGSFTGRPPSTFSELDNGDDKGLPF